MKANLITGDFAELRAGVCSEDFREKGPMLPPFDVFKVNTDGSTLWVGAAESLEAAKARVEELLKLNLQTEFVIFSQRTQNKLSFKCGDVKMISKTESPSENL
jgi:hypothetical protein